MSTFWQDVRLRADVASPAEILCVVSYTCCGQWRFPVSLPHRSLSWPVLPLWEIAWVDAVSENKG